MDFSRIWPLIPALIGIAVGAWLLLGRGPRRRRAYRRARRQLQRGRWAEAIATVRRLQQLGPFTPAWEGRVRQVEGECRRRAAEASLADKEYEQSLEHFLAAAELLNTSASEARDQVVGAVLAEVRRLFAAATGPQTGDVQQLIDRLLKLHSPCAEALFWRALCHVRASRPDDAMEALRAALPAPAADKGADKPAVEPPLYLGILLLRAGRAQEALRHLADANRLEPTCPFVTWQLGTALVAASGDASLAVRALQRALGPKGLPEWIKAPDRAWVEGMPPGERAFIPRLAWQQRFVCPVLGTDVALMVRQAKWALGQAYARLGNFQEAANQCEWLLNEAPPTLPVLRSLGLSLVRLGRYDEAFKHLRAAYELEEPKDPLTAGYLALCGARGKPNRPQDKPNNVAWAVRLLGRFHDAVAAPSSDAKERNGVPVREWAGLCSAVLAEARAAGLAVALDDQRRCCELLAGVDAVDAEAAAAYDALAATSLPAVRPEFAWLYCRSAQQQGVRGRHDLDLFGLTLRQAPAARAFYAKRSWDFDDVEILYLTRWTEAHSGCFPDALGPDYASRAEALLLERCRRLEEAGQRDQALEIASVLFQLLPLSLPARDCLARLHYRLDNKEGAAQLLAGWHRLEPMDPEPLVRLAVLEHERGNFEVRNDCLEKALELTQGRYRAAIAFQGARLLLAQAVGPERQQGPPPEEKDLGSPERQQGPPPEEKDLGSPQRQQGPPLEEKDLGSPQRQQGPPPEEKDLGSPERQQGPPPGTPLLALRAQGPEIRYLEICLHEQPDHAEALACLAAARWLAGDRAGLAELAPRLQRLQAPDARFDYLTAVCQLLAVKETEVLRAARRAARDESLAVESTYLIGLAQLRSRDAAASAALERAALAPETPSAEPARALLGCVAFAQRAYNDAVNWWQLLEPEQRRRRQLDEPFRAAIFLAALQALQAGRFEQAAEQLRLAGRLGWRERGLGQLLGLALFKEGQRRFFETPAAAEQPLPAPAEDSASEVLPVDPAQVSWDSDAEAQAATARAAEFLSQAIQAGLKDQNATYLLALAHKRLGKIDEAQAALGRCEPPDGDVWLQRGLLALAQRQLAQAEEELGRAWQLAPHSFAATANLLLTRVSLGRLAEALPLAPAAVALAPNTEEWYRFTLLFALLRSGQAGSGPDPVIVQMTAADEQRLLLLLRQLGRLDVVSTLIAKLGAARQQSAQLRDAFFETQLLAGRRWLARCDWPQAERHLAGLPVPAELPAPLLAEYHNLLGCAACLTQDFRTGAGHFQSALRLSGHDFYLHQNLALAHEWLGDLDRAELHWNRYFDLLERRRASDELDLLERWPRLAFEGYSRLALLFSDKNRWPAAQRYLEGAHRCRPDNVETLERLFHLYRQLHLHDQARRVLRQMQQLRPEEPQFELYELDLIEISDLDDLDRWLTDVAQVLQRYPSDSRVEERASLMVASALSFISKLSDQLTEQLNKIMKQVRSLDNYQINWSAVHELIKDLKRDFQRLRQIVTKCHTLATHADHRRYLRDLSEHLDRKIDYCRRWQGN